MFLLSWTRYCPAVMAHLSIEVGWHCKWIWGWIILLATVHPMKYTHDFVLLSIDVAFVQCSVDSHDVFIHICQGYFAGIWTIMPVTMRVWVILTYNKPPKILYFASNAFQFDHTKWNMFSSHLNFNLATLENCYLQLCGNVQNCSF